MELTEIDYLAHTFYVRAVHNYSDIFPGRTGCVDDSYVNDISKFVAYHHQNNHICSSYYELAEAKIDIRRRRKKKLEKLFQD